MVQRDKTIQQSRLPLRSLIAEASAGILQRPARSALTCLGTLLGEISRNEVVPLEEHVERIRAIEPADVNRVVRRVLGGPRATVLVGPFDGDESPV